MTQRRRLSPKNRKLFFKNTTPKKNHFSSIIIFFLIFIIALILHSKTRTYFFHQLPFSFSNSNSLINQNSTAINSELKKIDTLEKARVLIKHADLLKKDSINTNLKTKNDKKESKVPQKKPKKIINLQILNGCGEKNISSYFARNLKKLNYKITNTGNYKSFKLKKTFIVSQTKSSNAYTLAQDLKLPKSKVKFRKANSKSNLILIIGKDFKNFQLFEK